MLELLALAGAGAGAGASNSLAGAGSLITFPTLIALGVPPLGQRDQHRRPDPGRRRHALLLITSNDTFEAIVPALVAGSYLLLLFQRRLTAGNERSPC